MNLTPAVLSTATASCSALREPSRLNAIAFNVVNEQILVQGQSDQEAEKTYRQRRAISWPPTASNRPARMAHRLRKTREATHARCRVLIALALAFALVFTLRTVAWAGFSSLPDPVTHWAARIDEVCGRNHAA